MSRRKGPSDKTRNNKGYRMIITWPNGRRWDFRPDSKKVIRKRREAYLAKGAMVEVQVCNDFGAYDTVSVHAPVSAQSSEVPR